MDLMIIVFMTLSGYSFFLSSCLLCAGINIRKGNLQEAAYFSFWLEASLDAEQRMGSRLVNADCSTSWGVLLLAGGRKFLSLQLLDDSNAPLFPAEELAGCTTGRISKMKVAAFVGGEECFKGLN